MIQFSDFVFLPVTGAWWSTLLLDVIVVASFVVGVSLFTARRAHNDALVWDWLRRGLLLLALLAASLGPTQVSNTTSAAVNQTDVFFAVDTTGSMAVGDARLPGKAQPVTRLSASREIIRNVMKLYPSARYAGINFASSANIDLPVTADREAVLSWVDNLEVEPTAVSAGSSLDQPLDTLIKAMQDVHAQRPHDVIVVYYLSDGESTSSRQRRTFSALREFVDGGAVISVGSAHGGQVPLVTAQNTREISRSASPTSPNGWVNDPDTKKPAISRMDASTLKSIADEMSVDEVDGSQSLDSLKSHASSRFLVEKSTRRRAVRSYMVWPFALIIAVLAIWELGVDVARMRRFL